MDVSTKQRHLGLLTKQRLPKYTRCDINERGNISLIPWKYVYRDLREKGRLVHRRSASYPKFNSMQFNQQAAYLGWLGWLLLISPPEFECRTNMYIGCQAVQRERILVIGAYHIWHTKRIIVSFQQRAEDENHRLRRARSSEILLLLDCDWSSPLWMEMNLLHLPKLGGPHLGN